MVTKRTKKKRGPADLTSRNNNARKRDIRELWKAVAVMDSLNDDLDRRVTALEEWKAKRSRK